jgi:A/G-specific adenine glycosylase
MKKRSALPFARPKTLSPSSLSLFRRTLLAWYDRYRRDLPWRRTKDPYAIFVSEMMLQQTQVKTALPYYQRWMKALPTWRKLDQAPLDQVLKLWEGLGYYRRARNLKAAAQMVQETFGGRLPKTHEEILRLPGVGPYSAGALLSIAFGLPFPLVDGNVARVFSRLFAISGDLKSGPRHRSLWDLAECLLDPKRPGDFNQALMELGATTCLPDNPLCASCPLKRRCIAFLNKQTGRFPTPPPNQRVHQVFMASAYVEQAGAILLRPRPKDARWWQGLWELPTAEGKTRLEARKNLESLMGSSAEYSLGEIKHQVTNHSIRLEGYRFDIGKKSPQGTPRPTWTKMARLKDRALPAAQLKLIRLVQKYQATQNK